MSVGIHSNTVQLLRDKSHVCYVSKNNALLKTYRCPSCDQFIKRAQHLEQHLTVCKERAKHVFPRNVYQLRETHFDKLNSFKFPYCDDQKLFKNMPKIGFEAICTQEEKFPDTDTTTWIDKHVPISVSISYSLNEQPIFFMQFETRSCD